MFGIFENETTIVDIIVCVMALILTFLLIIILFNCCTRCIYENVNSEKIHGGNYTDQEHFEEICSLIERYKHFESGKQKFLHSNFIGNKDLDENEFDGFGEDDVKVEEIYDVADNYIYQTPNNARKSPKCPIQVNELKQELEQYKIDHEVKIRTSNEVTHGKRRTWGGLQDESQFEAIVLPNKVNEEVQTTATLDRMQSMTHSNETTV